MLPSQVQHVECQEPQEQREFVVKQSSSELALGTNILILLLLQDATTTLIHVFIEYLL